MSSDQSTGPPNPHMAPVRTPGLDRMALDKGIPPVHTPGLDAMAANRHIAPVRTPGIDSNRPDQEMKGFIEKVQADKVASRDAARKGTHNPGKVTSEFKASPSVVRNPLPPRKWSKKKTEAAKEGETTAITTGPFCSINADPNNAGEFLITGGPISIGPKNYDVPAFTTPSTANTYLVYVDATGVEANRTDDHQYFLPGIKTCSLANLVMTTTPDPNYPDNINPTIAVPTGKIVFHVGKLVIAPPALPSFQPVQCGRRVATHCSGNFGYEPP